MMKKSIFVLLLTAALGMALTACGCRHNWVEASCETPRICSICGETEGKATGHQWVEANCEVPQNCSACGDIRGEPLGHHWEEANCETPKKCNLCGSTQGDPLPHTFGKWSKDGNTMSRSCIACAQVENAAYDRETYFLGNCLGHWHTDSFSADGSLYSAYALKDSLGLYLRLEENSILLHNGYRSFKGTYSFHSYEESEGNELYRFQGDFDGQSPLDLTYCENENGAMILVSSADYVFILKQYPEYTGAMSGLWATLTNNTIRHLHLKEDHTFEGELQGPVSGTWHIRPMTEEYGSRYMQILLSQESGSGRCIVFNRYFWGDETLGVDGNTSISCYLNRENITLKHTDPQTLEQQKTQLQSGIENILGTWVSRERSISSEQNNSSNTAAMVGYEFTFLEDGTFHSVMEEEKTGNWAFLDKPGGYARYFLYFDDNPNDKSWMFELYDDGRLHVSYYGEAENIYYKFERKSERVYHEAEGPLTGTWYPTVYKIYDTRSRKENSATRPDDFITFNDDGTLIANLMGQCDGIWEYESSMESGNSGITDTFRLIINGKEEPYHINCLEDDSINLNYYEDGLSYSCIFLKGSTKEQMDFIDSGMERIVGDWVSTEFTESSLSGGNDAYYENTDQYTVSIHADGTFEYHYHQQGSGTWLYDGYDASSNQLTYTFSYDAPIPFSYRYCIDKDDVLFGWFQTETKRIGYYFERAQ